MDKTLEIVVAAAVLIMIAVVIIFLVSDRAGNFGSATGEQADQANCDLLHAEYDRAKLFERPPEKLSGIKGEAQDKGCKPNSWG